MRQIILSVLICVLTLTICNGTWTSVAQAAPQRREIPPDPALEAMRKHAEKQRNEQRQSDLKHDTDELYKLASELKKRRTTRPGQ